MEKIKKKIVLVWMALLKMHILIIIIKKKIKIILIRQIYFWDTQLMGNKKKLKIVEFQMKIIIHLGQNMIVKIKIK